LPASAIANAAIGGSFGIDYFGQNVTGRGEGHFLKNRCPQVAPSCQLQPNAEPGVEIGLVGSKPCGIQRGGNTRPLRR